MATWIKATDRLPGIGKEVKLKFYDGEHIWLGNIIEELADMVPEAHAGLLWSDESETPPTPPSVEEAAKEYAKDWVGEYDPELQEEFDNIEKHFLAGAAHAQNNSASTLPIGIVGELEKANPYWFEKDRNEYAKHGNMVWGDCVAKLRELIAAHPDKTDKAINDLLSKITPEMQATIDAEMKIEAQPPSIQVEQKEIGKHCLEIREMVDTLPPEQFVHWFNQQYILIKK